MRFRLLMKGDVVDAHLVPVGDGPDALGQGLPLDLFRVGVDDDVGAGGDLLDAGFDLFGDGVGPLERQVAVDVDRHVHEKHRAGAADAHLPDVEHAFDLLRGLPELLRQAVRRPVEEDVDRPPAQPVADEEHDESHAERGQRVGLFEETGVARRGVPAQPDDRQPEDDHRGAPDIGRKMKRVGLEGLALVFFGGRGEHPGAADVDADGHGHDEKGPEAGVDVHRLEEEPDDGLVDDPGAGHKKQHGFDQGGEIFDLAVAVGMIVVRRLVGDVNGQQGDDGGDEVERRVGRFRQDPETARDQADDELHPRQEDGGEDGIPGGGLFPDFRGSVRRAAISRTSLRRPEVLFAVHLKATRGRWQHFRAVDNPEGLD